MKNYGFYFFAAVIINLYGSEIIYNQERNTIEIVHEIEVVDVAYIDALGSSQGSLIFTPPAPYDTATFTILAPRQVALGQEFTIYYTMYADGKSNIPFWADLIPDGIQESMTGLHYVRHTMPTLGKFDHKAASTMHKGGKGKWLFTDGIRAQTMHELSVTLCARKKGMKKFISVIATNPPSYMPLAFAISE
jgi:hypothetical protein